MNMKLDKHLLSEKFQIATGCSKEKADKHTQKYITLCAQQILLHLNKNTNNDYVFVALDSLRRELGDLVINKQRYYVWNEFLKIAERIIVPVVTGNKHGKVLSMVALNYDLEEILIAAGDGKELSDMLYRDFEGSPIEFIPIDMFSIRSFIAGNMDIKNRTEKINANLYHALRIKLIAEANDGLMPHVINESKFGRKYYKGPNLQNTPKIVRHAALGDCHEYDLESSVFAWKMSLMTNAIKKYPATADYLDFKNAKRKQLAQTVFGNDSKVFVDIIKQAITAIGFGAPARVSGYVVDGKYEPPALSTIITSQDKLTTFLQDPWVVDFIDEQKRMTNLIVDDVKSKKEQLALLREIPELLDKANRLRPNSIISYLYQHSERNIIESIIELARDREVLLTVHDCIYTRRPIKLVQARETLQQWGDFFKISHKEHTRFAYDHNVVEHRARIQEEERLAKGITNHIIKSAPWNSDMKVVVRPLQDNDHYTGEGYSECNYDPEMDPFFDEE